MLQFLLIFCSFGLLQLIVYITLGAEFLFKSYPLLIHLPLFLLLKFHHKCNTYIAGIATLSAYLFCTPRKWVGTLISSFKDYNETLSFLVQIAITIPLLLLIIKYIVPYVTPLKFESNKILKFFISVLLIYYVIEYALTVYTNLLYVGGAVIVELMDTTIVMVYFIFSIIYLRELYTKKEIEVERTVLKFISDNIVQEIEQLREAQKQSAIYLHDGII